MQRSLGVCVASDDTLDCSKDPCCFLKRIQERRDGNDVLQPQK
eukprot:IDg9124t1